MQTAADILKKLEKVDLLLSMQVALEETAREAVSQQKQQLQQGLRSDDSTLPDYSFRSIFQYGKPPGPIRLYDQGDYYRGMYFVVHGKEFFLDSADEKTTMLKKRYGEDIAGLGSEAKENYIEVLEPVFLGQIKDYLK